MKDLMVPDLYACIFLRKSLEIAGNFVILQRIKEDNYGFWKTIVKDCGRREGCCPGLHREIAK
jgi:hypothetical protein